MNRYINQLALLTDKLFFKYKKQINTKEKIGVLVSGGIDSSIIAYYCKKYFPKQTILFSFGSLNSKDRPYVDLLQKHLQLPINYLTLTQESVNTVIPTVKQILQQLLISNFKLKILNSITHLSLAVGYYLIFQEISKHRTKTVFTGQGPDVLMAGYHKYKKLLDNSYQLLGKSKQLSEKYKIIRQTIVKDLNTLEIDKVRDNTMASYHKISLINPYLEPSFIDLSIKIPVKYKLVKTMSSSLQKEKQRGVLFVEKYIERLWGKSLKLPEKIVWRPKMAFQYSTHVQKLVQKAV